MKRSIIRLGLIAGALELAGMGILFWLRGGELAVVLHFHVLATLLIILEVWTRPGAVTSSERKVFYTVLAAVFPGIGPPICVLADFMIGPPANQKINDDSDPEAAEDIAKSNETLRYLSAAQRARQQGYPLPQCQAVFAGNSYDDKVRMIRRLKVRRDPEVVYWLRQALCDDEYKVSCLAATSLSAIEHEWTSEMENLEQAMADTPQDLQVKHEFITQALLIMRSNLCSSHQVRAFLTKAREECAHLHDIGERSADHLLRYGQVAAALGLDSEAKRFFSSAVKNDPLNTTARFWKAETHFRLGEIDEVVSECRVLKTFTLSPLLAKRVDFWIYDDAA